jgi:hypothetical protein
MRLRAMANPAQARPSYRPNFGPEYGPFEPGMGEGGPEMLPPQPAQTPSLTHGRHQPPSGSSTLAPLG